MTDTHKTQPPLRPNDRQLKPTEWLNTNETADHLGLQPKTLANMRSLGTGPIFHKLGGKVWYIGQDIIAYRNRRRYIASGVRDES